MVFSILNFKYYFPPKNLKQMWSNVFFSEIFFNHNTGKTKSLNYKNQKHKRQNESFNLDQEMKKTAPIFLMFNIGLFLFIILNLICLILKFA